MEREVSVKAKEAERRVISPSAEDNSIINSPPPQRKPQANQEPPSGSVKRFWNNSDDVINILSRECLTLDDLL